MKPPTAPESGAESFLDLVKQRDRAYLAAVVSAAAGAAAVVFNWLPMRC
jgi:hypothetical protein